MAQFFAIVLALVGVLFVYLALQTEGQLAHYLTVALVAFVNAALCGATFFVEE